MHHFGRRKWIQSILAGIITIAISHTPCLADGFRNPPPTATGIAKANANTVFVKDSSAVTYNPANLTMIATNDVQISATFARSDLSWDSAGIAADKKWNLLPSIFSATPVGDNGLVFGLGMTSPHGQGSSWDRMKLATANLPATASAVYEAEMMMVNISPALALPINDRFQIGAALDIAYSSLALKQSLIPAAGTYGLVDVDGSGIGAHAGITWQASDAQRATFTYRSPMYIKYKGDFTVKDDTFSVFAGTADGDLTTRITFPTIISAGYGIQLSNALQIEAQIEWIEWSLYRKAKFSHSAARPISNVTLVQNWEDTWTFGTAASYDLNDAWKLHFGYAFIPSPIPDESYSPSFADADRHVLSSGVSYKKNKHSFNLAYAYSLFKDRHISSTENSSYAGCYTIEADLIGTTYKYTF